MRDKLLIESGNSSFSLATPYALRKSILVLWAFALGGSVLACFDSRAERLPLTPADYHRAAAEFRAMQMRNENGLIPENALMNALQQKKEMRIDPAAWPGASVGGTSGQRVAGIDSNSWVWLGPGNIGGRMRSILINPTNTAIMWAGSVCGGVWKTTNNAASWYPLADFMVNLAIGSMVMDPGNPDMIYAGTGEGFSSGDALRGAGIFKSIDGGTTWSQLPSTANSSFYYVNRLSISPTNHLVILAATGTGIWRSTDGGGTWSQQYNTRSVLDLDYHPTDGTKAVASGSTYGATAMALYTLDGGLTWLTASGLPTAGRIEVAYAASSPNVVYASCNNNSGEVYLSTDGGVTYALRNTGKSYLSSQGWYDNIIWVDPTNPNILIVGGTDLWRSTDGGVTLTDIGGYSGGIHPDQHMVVNIPGYNGSTVRTIFVGNDGGMFRGADAYSVSPGGGWTELNNNLGITEFYGGAGNATSGTVIGGAQDNGTLRRTAAANTESWSAMFGGDGGRCAADQTDPNYFYGEYVYLQIHRSVNGGGSSSYIWSGIGDAGLPDPDAEPTPDGYPDPDAQANFIAPILLDPNNPNILLGGGSNLWRSVNVKAPTPSWGNAFTNPGNGSFISAITVAPGNSDIIWVGFNNGDVYATANGTAVNPTWTRKDLGSPNLPDRVCTRLTVDPIHSSVVYATFGGFSADNVYRTTDGGTTWANIASGLPAAPVRSLVIAPFNTNYLYVGTEVGVFASATSGATWSPANDGPANVSVEELFWMGQSLVAVTHGRGFFRILVASSPVISVSGTSLVAESCPNGVIDPGEMVTVNFSLTNAVKIPTTNLVVTLLTTNGVVLSSSPQNYGAIVTGAGSVTRSFSFMATGQCGGNVLATLQLQDGSSNLGTVSTTFRMGVPRATVLQNFDSVTPPALPPGWTVSFSGVGAAWASTSAQSDSTPNSMFAQDPSGVSDNGLISPLFAVTSSAAQVTFRHNFDFEPTYDGGVLDIAYGGGAFNDILTAGGSFGANGYNDTIVTGGSNPVEGRLGWTGNSGGFVTTIVNLPAAAAGQSVRLRWRCGSDVFVGANGWYLDTITLNNGYDCCIPHPQILSINTGNPNVTITWSSQPGLSYRLQYSTNLSQTIWTDVAGDVLASGGTASKTDTIGAFDQKYYRVKQLP
jgi:photosystem II stability/assembly factor-like uncharacterized protein